MSLLDDLKGSVELEVLQQKERYHVVLRLYRMAQKVEDVHPLEPRHSAYCNAIARALRAEAERMEKVDGPYKNIA